VGQEKPLMVITGEAKMERKCFSGPGGVETYLLRVVPLKYERIGHTRQVRDVGQFLIKEVSVKA